MANFVCSKKLLLCVALLVALLAPLRAQEVPVSKIDSSSVELRKFDAEKLADIKDSREYRYDREPDKRELGFFDRLWEAFIDAVLKMLFNPQSNEWARVVLYVVCGAVILYGVLKLSGADVAKLLYRKGQGNAMGGGFTEDDLHGRNFHEEIAQAVRDGQLREAVRLQYLLVLKNMADRGVISWKIDKTNREYALELKDGALKKPFSKITYIFENAYYGHFPVSETVYGRIDADFSDFRKKIAK